MYCYKNVEGFDNVPFGYKSRQSRQLQKKPHLDVPGKTQRAERESAFLECVNIILH